MSAFYTCSKCGKEFLGPDNIPIHEGDHVQPVCFHCSDYVASSSLILFDGLCEDEEKCLVSIEK